MKKTLLASTWLCLAVLSVQADLIWYEPFNYADGPTIVTGTNADGSTNWVRHSGSASPSDSLLSGHKLQVSTSSGTGSPAPARTDDVNRKLANAPGSYVRQE